MLGVSWDLDICGAFTIFRHICSLSGKILGWHRPELQQGNLLKLHNAKKFVQVPQALQPCNWHALLEVIHSAFLCGKLGAKLFNSMAEVPPFPKYLFFIVLQSELLCAFCAAGGMSVLYFISHLLQK